MIIVGVFLIFIKVIQWHCKHSQNIKEELFNDFESLEIYEVIFS